jgi:uncharacterized membrane protein
MIAVQRLQLAAVWRQLLLLAVRLAILVVSLTGMGISAYLTFVHYAGLPLYCTSAGGCHVVQSSAYATLLTVPVSLLGFALYAAILGCVMLVLIGDGSASRLAPFVLLTFALSGTVYSAYLTWLEVYRIYAICVWCITSASLLAAILSLSAVEMLVPGRWRDDEEATV